MSARERADAMRRVSLDEINAAHREADAARAELKEEREKVWEAWRELAIWREAWERLPKDEEPRLEKMLVEGGNVEIRMRSTHAFQQIGAALVRMLDEMSAKNCVEARVIFDGGDFVVEVRRALGKTMAELRGEAEAEVARLRDVICIGGAMYRGERAAMGIPGGIDPADKLGGGS